MAIERENIFECNSKGQNLKVSIEEVMEIYILFERPFAKGVIINKKCFVSFRGLENMQFIISEIVDFKSLSFIEPFKKVNLDIKTDGFFGFLIKEFWQGNNLYKKAFHLIITCSALLVFNLLLFYYSSEKNISNVFTGLLMAVSFFVAIFSVFTVNHEQLNRKKPFLFETGKIAYYFSVDKNLTKAGFFAIVSCLFGTLIVKDDSSLFIPKISCLLSLFEFLFSRKGLVFILVNISFKLTFITLRSLYEFYINRPAQYVMGELKDDFLKDNK